MSHKHQPHHHHHGKSSKIVLILYFVGLGLFITGLFLSSYELIQRVLYLSSFVLAGFHVIIEGIIATFKDSKEKKRFVPNLHLLMTIAAIGAIVINEYNEAALLILIFAGAHFLEDYAESKSSKEISNLLKLNPTKARLLNSDGTSSIVDVSSLKIGDKLLVLNGDIIPSDGIVIEGHPLINEASITGEGLPIEKNLNDLVYGATLNGDTSFKMEVTVDVDQTAFAKIVTLVSNATTNVSPTAALIKKIEPIYVITILLLSPLFFLLLRYPLSNSFYNSFYKTMVFLIGASPCALAVVDIPATLASLSNLAKRGVLVKGGNYLALLANTKVVAMDKTGTLTEGKPVVTNTYFNRDLTKEEVENYLMIIKGMESGSNHPLANAVLAYLEDIALINIETTNMIGVGLSASYLGDNYLFVKHSYLEQLNVTYLSLIDDYQKEGKTVVIFAKNFQVIGLFAVQDIAKEANIEAIKYFKNNRIKLIMLTGDHQNTGESIAKSIGIDNVFGSLLPEDKARIISDLQKETTTVMIGDGVNDAPALVASSIGVAMGSGTNIAIDVADVVLLKNDLNQFAYAHRLSKKLRSVIIQNIIIALVVIVFLTIMNLADLMNMGIAVFLHEGSTLLVVISGLRMLLPLRRKK